MGLTFACPGGLHDSMNDSLEGLIMRSINLGDNARSTLPSISFNGQDSEAFGPRKSLVQGSVSFNGSVMGPFHLKTEISMKRPTLEPEKSTKSVEPETLRRKTSPESTLIGPDSPTHEVVLKLQKAYKSFRTRRQLADCAVLVEQRWWKLLDFALLKRSSVSFFGIEKPESAVSRWSRARTRAAKVGKGLSKNEKALKLALQHWLEAIDPRHRYGHNLQFYYDCWLQCKSMQPFFYWLDVGEGKEVNLEEQCSRSKLQQQCIKYLGPKERQAYEVIIEDGNFMYRQSRQLLDSSDGPKDAKWIFVLSTSKKLYVGQKKKGTFQHSSFLAGGATDAAGRLVVENGVLKAVWPHSGHYRPTEENFHEFMRFLEENNVDVTNVKKSPTEEDDEHCSSLIKSYSGLNLAERSVSIKPETKVDLSRAYSGKASSSFETFEGENICSCSLADPKSVGGGEKSQASLGHEETEEEADEEIGSVKEANMTSSDGENEEESEISSHSKKQYIFQKKNLFLEQREEEDEEEGADFVASELILGRIKWKKGIESYQLGKQFSFKWTTEAGPRIGCVRDQPSKPQFRALEQVNLSPTSASAGMSRFASPKSDERRRKELRAVASTETWTISDR